MEMKRREERERDRQREEREMTHKCENESWNQVCSTHVHVKKQIRKETQKLTLVPVEGARDVDGLAADNNNALA